MKIGLYRRECNRVPVMVLDFGAMPGKGKLQVNDETETC